MTPKVRRVDFVADEWLGGTVELSPYDRGVYITICALIYSRGEAVGIELIRRHCGVHMRALRASLGRLEACGKVDLTRREGDADASSVSSRRCLEEICNTRLRLKKWAENLLQSGKNNGLDPPRPQARARRAKQSNIRDSLKEDSASLRSAPGSDPEAGASDGEAGVSVSELVAQAKQALSLPVASRPFVGKRDTWLNNLASFVGGALDGDARMTAWQAIEDCRAAGSREATPGHIRAAVDDLDRLYRAAHAEEAAA